MTTTTPVPTATATGGTLRLEAFYEPKLGPSAPSHAKFRALFATDADAAAFAALFPKSAKLRTSTFGTFSRETGENFFLATVNSYAILASDGVNGGRNETGIKRIRTILAAASKLGIEIEFGENGYPPSSNAYGSLAEFEAAIA